LLKALYGIRSERLLLEQLHYNLLFRHFVGLSPDDPIWHPTTFTKNRERILNDHVMGRFLEELSLRNPAGSSHAPFSEKGCTILVKLQRLALDTGKRTWMPRRREDLCARWRVQDEHDTDPPPTDPRCPQDAPATMEDQQADRGAALQPCRLLHCAAATVVSALTRRSATPPPHCVRRRAWPAEARRPGLPIRARWG
jgi:Transposase domain (DUF772)